MTTILVDVKHKLMFSDSRATVSNTSNDNYTEYYETNSPKLFKHPNGKLIAASFGCMGISFEILKNLGFEIPECLHGTAVNQINKNGQSGGILLMNCYNNSVCHIGYDVNDIGIKKEEYHRWFSNYSRICAGTGGDVAGNIFDKTKDPMRAISLASLIDKHSDTNIKTVKL